jgi:riboflavin biosynthesis pyrimidine reductase
MQRIWPDPAPLDPAGLVAAYTPTDRGTAVLRVNFVTSLDGAVTIDGYSAGLSGPADKRIFGILRMLCDALLVGAGTLRVEGYGPLRLGADRLAWRRAAGLDGYPPLVVVSRNLALDPSLEAFTAAPVRPVVLTCAAAPADRRAALAEVADVLVHGETEVDLAAGLADLHRRGLRQLLCEGGALLLGSLTAADLVDEVCLTVSPLLAGAAPGRISAGVPSPRPRQLVPCHVLTADDALFLRYARRP